MEGKKRKLGIPTFIYWVLLVYIVAALVWWFFSLYKQNEAMFTLQKADVQLRHPEGGAQYARELAGIEDQRRRNVAKYVGEGSIFFVLILVGAVYIYRSVRREFRAQRQQQNFVMAITHELKTPISVSRLNLETLQRRQLDEQKRDKLVQMTLQETLRLDDLINNILISSQLDGQSYKATREELDLSYLAGNVVQQFTHRYPDRPVRAELEEDVDLTGDPLLLKLLLSNLLENAQKYSPRERPIEVRLLKQGNAVQLSVADEGEGIPEEEKRNVFRKFYRIGNEQTRKAKGTGLGLYLCKKIAEDHGGRIHLGDNQPQGSIFTVQFPSKA
jgi:two-component system, OmpR family, sensor histidine kinase CiaH